MRGLVSALGGIRASGGGGDGLTVAVGRLLVRGAGASGGAVVAVAAAVVVIVVAIGHSHLMVVHLVDVAPQVASEWRMPDSKRNGRLRVNDRLKTKLFKLAKEPKYVNILIFSMILIDV